MIDLFGEPPKNYPKRRDFNDHVVIVKLLHGGGEQPVLEVQCLQPMKEINACTPDRCEVKELYAEVSWDAVKAAGDIELARLSARVDWTDPEEPWIEVEP